MPGEGSTGSVLSAEKQDEFARALAGSDPAADAAAPEPKAEPAPAGGTAPAVEGTEDVKPAVVDAQEPKGPIPYERFSEVNEERKRVLAELEASKADLEDRARAQATAYLEDVATRFPELRKAIYGDTAVPVPAVQSAVDPKQASDPIAKEVQELKAWKAEQDRQVMLDRIEDRCEASMSKYPEFKDPVKREFGEQLIAQQLYASRGRLTPEQIVEGVAKKLKAYEETVKSSYKQDKGVPARTVPAGVGQGAAPPPGQAPRKLSLNDGSTRRALAQAIELAGKGTE